MYAKRTSGVSLVRPAAVFRFAKAPENSKQIYAIMYAKRTSGVFLACETAAFRFAEVLENS